MYSYLFLAKDVFICLQQHAQIEYNITAYLMHKRKPLKLLSMHKLIDLFWSSGYHMLAQMMYRLGVFKLFEKMKWYFIWTFAAHLKLKKCLTYVTVTEFWLSDLPFALSVTQDQIWKSLSRKYYTTIIVSNTTMLQYWVYWIILIFNHSRHI